MSPVAVAIWSLALKPSDEPVSFFPQSDLRITNIALGDELADESGRTSVKLTYQTPIKIEEDEIEDEDEESPEPLSTTVLGSLTPGKIEQATVDLVLDGDEEYLFEIVGKNTVFLTGNYIDQIGSDNAPYGNDSDDDMEEDHDLREVSSDVEVDVDAIELPSGDEDADRFEEIDDAEAPKSLKRPRDSDAMETDTLSKSQQKKLNKKLKADGGKVVPTGSGDDEKKTKKEKKEKKEKQKAKEEVKDDGEAEGKEKEKKGAAATKTLHGGVQVTDIKIGTGPQAKNGKTASIRYIGKLTNGKIFDQSVGGKAFRFRLGEGSVIKGWDIGIAGMQVGGERELTIPPAMGYGKKASGGIPPNSTLIFSCKLISLN
jgi:FK506-binding nuclear protein